MKKISLNREAEAPSLLIANEVRQSLRDLDGWQLTEDHKMIYREFILQDFMAAIDLINRIALIAQEESHHPDIHLTQYRNLRVGLTTHDVGGLSEKDFTLASKITAMPMLFKKHDNGVVVDQRSQKKEKNKPKQKPRYVQKDILIKKKQRKGLASKN